MSSGADDPDTAPGRATLDALAVAARRAGIAQLVARGYTPLGPAEPDPGLVRQVRDRQALWRPVPGHAGEVCELARDGTLGDAVEGLDPWLASSVSVLAAPAELLLLFGADDRALPTKGRNSYGFPIYDPSPGARLSSCTCTPPDRDSIGVADSWRARTLIGVMTRTTPPPPAELRSDVTRPIAAALGLPAQREDSILLLPSGTDGATVAAGILLYGHGRPLVNILVGAREMGSGTRAAAGGAWFSSCAPLGQQVQRGDAVAGLGPDLIRIVDVAIRDADGRARRAFDVEAEVEAHVEHNIASGATVLVHAVHGSKTGLTYLDPPWIRLWRRRHPERLRIMVDAAQARVSPPMVRRYLTAGGSVVITGSKALSAPLFCGALILDDSLHADAARCESLPAGFAALLSQADVPPALAVPSRAWSPANLGLLARWHVALAEWSRLSEIPSAERKRRTLAMIQSLTRRLADLPGVEMLPLPTPHSSIVSFAIRDGEAGFLPKTALEEIHRTLIDDAGVYLGQPVQIAGQRAVLRAAVGAATLTRTSSAASDEAAIVATTTSLADAVAGTIAV